MCRHTGFYTGGGRDEGQEQARLDRPIRFGTYNIRNGRNRGLEYALRGMYQANMNLGVLQETKLKKCIYTRDSSSYKVVATDAPITHSVGVAIFYRTADHFSVEAFQVHGANVISFQLASGDRQWFIVGCYVPPDDASTTEDIVTAIEKRPRGAALLVVRNFIIDLAAPEGQDRDKVIAAELVEEVLDNMSSHFLPRHKPWLKDGLK